MCLLLTQPISTPIRTYYFRSCEKKIMKFYSLYLNFFFQKNFSGLNWYKVKKPFSQVFPPRCFGKCMIRATPLILLKISVYFTKRIYFFYFIPSLLQNTHISLSILNIYFNKIFILLHFLLFQDYGKEESEVNEINKKIYTKLQ